MASTKGSFRARAALQLGALPPAAAERPNFRVALQRLQRKAELDTHAPHASGLSLSFLRKRSRVTDIVIAGQVLLLLTQAGVCVAFNKRRALAVRSSWSLAGLCATGTLRRLCFLHGAPDEVVRSLFYNKHKAAVIMVCVYPRDRFSSLRCTSIGVEEIARGDLSGRQQLFTTELLEWPGFVEFDEANEIILTYSSTDKVFKVWDQATYALHYQFADAAIQEVKISHGALLHILAPLTSEEAESSLNLRVMEAKRGEELVEVRVELTPGKRVSFIELFGSRLLYMQEGEPLMIMDLATGEKVAVPEFPAPEAFVFLHERMAFLAFTPTDATLWSVSGEVMANLTEYLQASRAGGSRCMYVSHHQEFVVSFRRMERGGAISVVSLSDGAEIARVAGSAQAPTTMYALQEVCSITMDEEDCTVYSGDRAGVVTAWGH